MHSEKVCLAFEVAGELQEGQGNCEARRLAYAVARPPAKEDQGDGGQVRYLTLGGLLRAVPGGNMGDFVGHHARQLGLAAGQLDQARIDIEIPTWQGKRVDFVAVNDLDRKRHASVGVANQILSHSVDVLGDDRVVNDLRVAFNLGRQLFAERDFLFDRIEVDALTDVPFADRLDVFLGLLRLFLLDFAEGARRGC